MKHSIKERRAREKIPVCIVSSHPQAPPQWRRLLTRVGFAVQVRQVDIGPKSALHNLITPAASVYVVDAHGMDWATEALVARVRVHHPEARIVVVGPQFDEANAFPLFHLRVRGLVKYSEARRQLPRAVQFVVRGGLWAPRKLITNFVESLRRNTRANANPPRSHMLSRREREILNRLLKNKSNKEIANQLHISESTVKFHVSNILSKFGVQRRTDLILRCFQETAV